MSVDKEEITPVSHERGMASHFCGCRVVLFLHCSKFAYNMALSKNCL
jgi:hypothetical protein